MRSFTLIHLSPTNLERILLMASMCILAKNGLSTWRRTQVSVSETHHYVWPEVQNESRQPLFVKTFIDLDVLFCFRNIHHDAQKQTSLDFHSQRSLEPSTITCVQVRLEKARIKFLPTEPSACQQGMCNYDHANGSVLNRCHCFSDDGFDWYAWGQARPAWTSRRQTRWRARHR